MALWTSSFLSSTSSSCPSLCFRFNPLLFSSARCRRSTLSLSRSRHRGYPFFAISAEAESTGIFTSPEDAKSFDFSNEERIYKWWESQGYFKPNIVKGGDPFVVPMPPPNVTGSLHMGHAMFVTLEDIMIRYNRMKGRPTLWLPGTDHAGIATQLVVERMLATEGVKRADLGRDEFTKRVWEWKQKYGGTITNQIKRLGASCDWTREHFTLDEQLSRAVVEAFIRLHEKGLIYQGSYMVNWSPNLQTAVSDLEVEYSEEPGSLYYIKYRVAGGSKSDFLTIATTRPETLFGDTAIAVNPQDIMIRYNRMKGRPTLWLPGTDHAGIATQLVVERMLATEGVKRADLGRDEFTKRVWEWKQKYGGTITNQIKRLGASCDWTREHFTLDEQLSRAVVEAFIRLHEKGLIYQGSYMVNWSPNLQTAVSDLEVEYSEEPGSLYYIKYRVAGGSKSDFLTIATTRPETLFGDTAIAVNPQDIMIRYNRMKGRPTLWLPGTDHAGIATQLVVERMLATEGVKRADLGRDEFTKRVWEWKQKYGGTITNQIKRLGASCDWTREHFTLDEQLSRAVVEAFIRLHEKGLIYQGSYMVNWSPNLQTAVSDLEVEYSEEPGSLYYIKYRVAGGSKSDFLTIATTRPETLFGDTAIAVNPQDERYAKYIGKQAIVPLTFGRHVPIISDKYVDKDFGTGVLKISPGHDHNDYLLARKLGLPILNVMNKDGTLNEVAGLYAGLDRFEARKKLWSDLEETGLAVKKETHTSRVPRSQRGGEIIEPLVSKQWFVTMEPLAERALEAVSNGELNIIPERFEKIYKHWLSNIKDWCISRQLWWGHRIPVWYVTGKDCEEEYIVARSHREALTKAQEKYGKNVEIYQDPDVLDTWFSSSLWPFSTLGWPDESAEDFKRFYPTSVLETGHDILFFWVARMVMMGIEFTGTVPFSNVYLHGLIRDSQGRKMSKTLGNVIDPLDTISEYGTDALRFTLALGTAGQDLNLSTERLSSNKAFTNKLWNAGKFILRNLPRQDDTVAWEALRAHKFDNTESVLKLPLPECWVVSKLHVLVDEVTASYEKLFFGDVGREIYDFFWSDFADWYIEASKARLYRSGDHSVASVSQAALLYIFENILKLLHPFMPFVTEELWQALPSRGEALIVSAWPPTSLPRNIDSIKKFENLQALTRAIRNVRAEYAVEPAKLISASIVANPDVIQYISGERDVLALLSRLDLGNVNFVESPPGDANQSVHIVAGEGLEAYLPLSDMVDISAEVQRLSKRLVKLQAEYDGLMARLSSPSFVEKAPEDIVRGVREKAAEAEEKLTLTRNRHNFLKSKVLIAN